MYKLFISPSVYVEYMSHREEIIKNRTAFMKRFGIEEPKSVSVWSSGLWLSRKADASQEAIVEGEDETLIKKSK